MDTYISHVMLDLGTRAREPKEIQGHNDRILKAYASLVANGDFRIVLEDLTQGILLKPCNSPEDEGERRLVLKIMEAIKQAQAALRKLANEDER